VLATGPPSVKLSPLAQTSGYATARGPQSKVDTPLTCSPVTCCSSWPTACVNCAVIFVAKHPPRWQSTIVFCAAFAAVWLLMECDEGSISSRWGRSYFKICRAQKQTPQNMTTVCLSQAHVQWYVDRARHPCKRIYNESCRVFSYFLGFPTFLSNLHILKYT